jgi:hypothetical protein
LQGDSKLSVASRPIAADFLIRIIGLNTMS